VNVVVSASSCSQVTTYHASAVRDFPATFKDGTIGVNGLGLFLNDNSTSAYIRIPWINTTIAIHKLAGHIGVVIQSPASVASKSVGLCSLGCPDHSKLSILDSIDYVEDCAQEAIIACSINNLRLSDILVGQQDQYLHKCIFDVLQSNNPNSSWISLAMVDSWFSLGPTYHLSRYSQQQTTATSSSTAASSSRSTIITHITVVSWCLSLYAMLYMLFS